MKRYFLLLPLLCLLAMPAHRAFGASDGKELYTKNCKECHGIAGDGKSPSGKLLNPKIKQDLSDPAVQAKLTDEQITRAITDGTKEMKPVKEKKNLSDDDVKAIVQYLRTLKKT